MLLSKAFRFFTKAIKPKFEVSDMAALMFTVHKSKQTGLKDVIQAILDNKMNLTHIESRPAHMRDADKGYTFIIDVETPDPSALEKVCAFIKQTCGDITFLGSLEVPWFPRKLYDLDIMPQKNRDLPWDHPGHKDQNYKIRRQDFANIANSIKITDKMQKINYNEQETQTWNSLYHAVTPYFKKHACSEHFNNFKDMEERGLIKENEVPQIGDVSMYLMKKTGFQLKPISGFESDRDFLNCLAFKVFPSALHMRHHSLPYFSIDPDIAHEILGHAPMLADNEFSDFIQEIGLASLGATDEDIDKLTTLYFYSVELGLLLNDQGQRKIYGARVLSSFDEIEHAVSAKPEIRHLDPFQACNMKYHRRHLQSIYWFCENFREAKTLLRRFTMTRSKPFHASYDKQNQTIKVDHKIKAV